MDKPSRFNGKVQCPREFGKVDKVETKRYLCYPDKRIHYMGYRVGVKHVRSLMRLMGLEAT